MNGSFRIWKRNAHEQNGRNAHEHSAFINPSNSAFENKYIIEVVLEKWLIH